LKQRCRLFEEESGAQRILRKNQNDKQNLQDQIKIKFGFIPACICG